MTTFALVRDGVVLSHFYTFEPKEAFPDIAEFLVEAPDDVKDGMLYQGGQFVDAAPFVPQEVSMRQARLALLGAGLLDQVEQAVKTLPRAAQIEWEFATTVQRHYGMVDQLATAFGWSEQMVDSLFIQAAQL